MVGTAGGTTQRSNACLAYELARDSESDIPFGDCYITVTSTPVFASRARNELG
jgi:hypothetical protein